jgi:chromosome segregation ATPase
MLLERQIGDNEKRHNHAIKELKEELLSEYNRKVANEVMVATHRLSSSNKDLESQLESLKRAKVEIDDGFDKSRTQISMLQRQLSERSRELEEIRSELADMRDRYEDEIRRLRQEHSFERSKIIQDAEEQCRIQLQKAREDAERDASALRVQIKELEVALQVIDAENEKVLNLNEDRLRDIEQLNAAMDELNEKKKREIEEMRKILLSESRTALERQDSDLRIYYEKEKSSLLGQIEDLNFAIKALEDKNRNLSQELNRARAVIEERARDIESLKKRLLRAEEIRKQEITELQEHFKSYKDSSDHSLVAMESKFSGERTSLETTIYQLKAQLKDLNEKIIQLEEDNIKLDSRLGQRADSIEAIREKFAISESSLRRENDDLRLQLDQVRKRESDIQERTVKTEGERQDLESKLRQSIELYENIKKENGQLYEILNARKKELGDIEAENERLKSSTRGGDKKAAVSNGESEDSELRAKIGELTHERDFHKRAADKLNDELAQKNKELREKIEALEKIREEHTKLLGTTSELKNKLYDRLLQNSSILE